MTSKIHKYVCAINFDLQILFLQFDPLFVHNVKRHNVDNIPFR